MPEHPPNPTAPAQDNDEVTLVETPATSSVQPIVPGSTSESVPPSQGTFGNAADETLIEPVPSANPRTSGATTARSATAPIAEQETLIEQAPAVSGRASQGKPDSRRFAEIPRLLGDYELLEELGRGGMGIVYRAKQRSVNRIVALKIIRPDRLASMTQTTRGKTIERFRNEAEAAARIHHDHLVTVYEVGCEAGCHYFSMRYVEGTSMSEVIRKNPAENRQAAAWMEPVCRAVDAVHRHGILHRDLKPQNILLENATGRALLADFGLAKFADDEGGLTQTGDAVGTPAYMAPEQFEDASRVGVAADIYSLGATLYCALSGRPPFQASSPLQTMKQVLQADAVPLRQLNPAVDRDLETICMKCLEKSPEKRYATAADLADELQRYLAGQPILARPISLPERAARWCRRNPLIASLTGATMAAVVFGIVALGVSHVRTEAARQRSEESFQDAMSAVNDLFTRVSEERLLNEPGLQPVRRDLLQRAREYYERFLQRRASDPALKQELAATQFRMGLIAEELESPDAALAWFDKARVQQQAQVAAQPDSTAAARALSLTLNAMGRVCLRLGQVDAAEKHFEDAQKLRDKLLAQAADPDDKFESERLLANSRMNLGLVEKHRGNFEQVRTMFLDAQAQRRKALPARPKDRAMRRDLAKGFYNLANLAVDTNDEAALREHIEEAIRRFQELVQENPRDLDDQYSLSLCYRLRADFLAALAQNDRQWEQPAIDDYASAARIVQRLSDLNPTVTKYLRELVRLHINLGQLSAQQEQLDDAIAHFRKALELLDQLAKQSSDSPDPRDAELRQTIESALAQLQAMKR